MPGHGCENRGRRMMASALIAGFYQCGGWLPGPCAALLTSFVRAVWILRAGSDAELVSPFQREGVTAAGNGRNDRAHC